MNGWLGINGILGIFSDVPIAIDNISHHWSGFRHIMVPHRYMHPSISGFCWTFYSIEWPLLKHETLPDTLVGK